MDITGERGFKIIVSGVFPQSNFANAPNCSNWASTNGMTVLGMSIRVIVVIVTALAGCYFNYHKK